MLFSFLRHSARRAELLCWGLLVVAALVASGREVLAGDVPVFNAFLSPPEECEIIPGETITVELMVDSTAVQFNGFEITLGFDSEILQFDGLLEGPLMDDTCPTHFADSSATDSTFTYVHILLCDGVSANGPGVLGTFTFLAVGPGVSPVEIVSDPDQTFLDAGLWIWPGHSTFPRQVVFANSEVCVLDPTSDVDVSDEGTTRPSIDFSVVPNPVTKSGVVQLHGRRAGQSFRMSMVDAGGRVVWSEFLSKGSTMQTFELPSRDRMPGGVYFLSVVSEDGLDATRKVVVVD